MDVGQRTCLMSRKMTKKCEACGVAFETQRSNTKYCSKRCANRAYARKKKLGRDDQSDKASMKICTVCGKIIENARKDQSFCSAKCRNKAVAAERKKKRLENRSVFKKTCEVCGAAFETYHRQQKYCSKKCKNFAHTNPSGLKTPRYPEPTWDTPNHQKKWSKTDDAHVIMNFNKAGVTEVAEYLGRNCYAVEQRALKLGVIGGLKNAYFKLLDEFEDIQKLFLSMQAEDAIEKVEEIFQFKFERESPHFFEFLKHVTKRPVASCKHCKKAFVKSRAKKEYCSAECEHLANIELDKLRVKKFFNKKQIDSFDGYWHVDWTDDENEYLRSHYGGKEMDEISRCLRRTKRAIQLQAHKLGLKKKKEE